ncbi:hypothetical protein [Streptomyces sp. NPDC021356]|uniref:hypothetical protein n=1 Tax=Streptomyces sp. NPDC021356 TaxID=3154900 RepID=UPI0033C64786
METVDMTAWEPAVLDGGPADGMRVEVAGRPRVVQVTYPCRVEGEPTGVRVEGVHLYRRAHDGDGGGGPVRYGFDVASP